MSNSPLSTDAALAADLHLQLQADALDLEGVTLVRERVLQVAGFATVRYRQQHAGVDVLDSAAAVHLSPDGRVLTTVLQVARGLTTSSAPSLSALQARHALATRTGVAAATLREPELAISPHTPGGRLVWSIVQPTKQGGVRYLLDAHNAKLLARTPLARHAQGRVYPINPIVTPMTQDVELTSLVVSTPQRLTGWEGNLTVANYVSGSALDPQVVAEQTLEPSMLPDDFLYDPPASATDASDAFAQVALYYHLTRFRDFMETDLGLDTSAANWKLTAVANVGDEGALLDNAFFSPDGIAGPFASPNYIGIGQGTMFDWADDSDVLLHEATHYFTHNAIGYNGGPEAFTSYGVSTFGGSIDEGVSDYLACTVNGDPLVGEASLMVVGAERDLSDTSKTCPDDIGGLVHADGEIIGSLGWQLRDAFGNTLADQLVWGAAALLMPNPSMGDFGRGLQQTAADLEMNGMLTPADVMTIDGLIASRGLDECDEELPLRPSEPRTGNLTGIDPIASALGGNCALAQNFGVEQQSFFHYVVTPEPGAEGVRVWADMVLPEDEELNWSIYARAGQHVGLAPNELGMDIVVPTADAFDYAVTEITEETGEIIIDANSSPPFDSNTTYHFVIVHKNCLPTTFVMRTMEASGTGGAGGAGGAGVGGAGVGGSANASGTGGGGGDDSDGCGCRTAGSGDGSQGTPWAALLLLGAGMALRRRRR